MKSKEDRINEFKEFMSANKAPGLVRVEALDAIGFFTAPASTIYHGAYEGGLFDHSLEVATQLINLTDKLGLEWTSVNSPLVVGLFHDLCKCDNYVWDIETNGYTCNPEIILPGHGEKSVRCSRPLCSAS